MLVDARAYNVSHIDLSIPKAMIYDEGKKLDLINKQNIRRKKENKKERKKKRILGKVQEQRIHNFQCHAY